MKTMDFYLADNCNCYDQPTFEDGSVPVNSKLPTVAKAMFLSRLTQMFFGVHLDGKHVLAVCSNGVWYGGLSGFRFQGAP